MEATEVSESHSDGSLLDAGLTKKIAALQHIPLFRKCSDTLMYRIAQKLRRSFLEIGEVLVEEGKACDRFYLLEEGHVQVWSDDGDSVALDGPGGVIGDPRVLLDPQDQLWQHNCIARQGDDGDG